MWLGTCKGSSFFPPHHYELDKELEYDHFKHYGEGTSVLLIGILGARDYILPQLRVSCIEFIVPCVFSKLNQGVVCFIYSMVKWLTPFSGFYCCHLLWMVLQC